MSTAAPVAAAAKAKPKASAKTTKPQVAAAKSKPKAKKVKAAPKAGSSKAKTASKSVNAASKTANPKTNSPKVKAVPAAPAAGQNLDATASELLAAAAKSSPKVNAESNQTASTQTSDAEARAKALANIKIGPKGVYTEDSIRVYLQEIGRIRLLRPDEEIELARKIADLLHLEELAEQFESDHGHYPSNKEWAVLVEMTNIKFRRRLMLGRRAKEKMVQSNLRLVVSIAKKYMNRGLSFQDLIQEGSLGLIRAAEKFDHEKGYKFSTYATWWIRQAITRAIADQSRTIRVPVHMIETMTKVRNVSRLLVQELGREPTTEEIAEHADLSLDDTRCILKMSRQPLSLDQSVGDYDDSFFGEFLQDHRDDDPLYETHQKALKNRLDEAMQGLNYREREILRLRFGLADGYTYTLEEVGKIFSVTRERVRQIESKAVRKLQQPYRRNSLAGFLNGVEPSLLQATSDSAFT